MRYRAAVVLLVFILAQAAFAEPRDKRVLLIGIDGLRPDAIAAAVEATHLHSLVKEGAFAPKSDVLGDRNTGADTSTGPGWSSAITGVWADKHEVRNNLFRKHKLKEFPSFFHRVKEAKPSDEVAVLMSWTPFDQFLFAGLEGSRMVADGDKIGYLNADKAIADAAEKLIAEENPKAMFVYFGETDLVGHGYGFHPKSPKYTSALEVIDKQIARVHKAMRSRKTFEKEDWLTIICTDHGGRGREHGLGDKVPEIRTGFILLHGPSVKPGQVDEPRGNVDVAAIALTHLGVKIKAEWGLDGKAFGLKE